MDPISSSVRSARLTVQSCGTSPAAVELSGNGVSVAVAALSVSAPNLIVPAMAGASGETGNIPVGALPLTDAESSEEIWETELEGFGLADT